MLRQSVFGRLAGYEDVNDAERLRHDPAMRWIVGGKAIKRSRSVTEPDGPVRNRWLRSREPRRSRRSIRPLDRPVHAAAIDEDRRARHGLQRESDARRTRRQRLERPFRLHLLSSALRVQPVWRSGRCALRPGNVHSADGWEAVLKPVVARYRGMVKRLAFRGDAAFANPEMYEFLEAEGIDYAIRLPANRSCRTGSLSAQAPGWTAAARRAALLRGVSAIRRRVGTARAAWLPRWSGTGASCSPRVGFIVTNLARPAESVVGFYNQRGTAEQWIKEGKNAIKWTRLSCRAFAANAVRLQLHVLAYNLGNFLRTLAMPKAAEPWSLTSLARS